MARRGAARRHLVIGMLLLAGCTSGEANVGSAVETMAGRIVDALDPVTGERAVLRYNPDVRPGLAEELRAALQDRGVQVELISYDPVPTFAETLAHTDIYVWLPAGSAVTHPEEAAQLVRWLDAGRGRQVHFHWGAGTVDPDGLAGEHSAAYDSVYLDALDIDYQQLDRTQVEAIGRLKTGVVTVTTPAGTNIQFSIGDRPFNRQNGDASAARMSGATTRIDREIELPAGVVRVAPIEESVEGVLVIPTARFGDVSVEELRLRFERGKVTQLSATRGEDAVRAALARDSSLTYFREFAIGFNPKLVVPAGQRWLPYFGYGAGVVRMSLGDNTELGGAVRGGAVRWFFFADATVRAGDSVVVEGGRLRSSNGNAE